METAKIMVVEDEGIVARDIQNCLQSRGYVVSAIAASGEEALKKAVETRPDLVLMDIMLKGNIDGVEAAQQIRDRLDIPVIFLTAYADENTLKRAKITEPFGYIVKPFRDLELYSAVQMALYKHQMEKKLKESEQWLATTLSSIGDAVIASDANGHVLFLNPTAESITGWNREDALGKDLEEVFNIQLIDSRTSAERPVTRALEEGVTVNLTDHILIAKDRTQKIIGDSVAPIKTDKGDIIGAVLVFTDITKRKQTEEQLFQASKLAAMGQLGAGIAHELNQPITAIQGFSQRIKRDSGRQIADHADELDLIINATHRMARIVDNIRTFSRQSDFKTRPIDPLVPLDDALMLISEQLRLHSIEVEKPAGDGLPRVMGDQVKLQQVFSNLIMNARDALETLPSDRPRRLVLGVRAEGDRVVYSVEDNGPGISEKDQARIFDPFFTTKEVGKGTGLGLSITHGIVTDHGGEIRYEPVEGGGARFLVSLPMAPLEITEAVGG